MLSYKKQLIFLIIVVIICVALIFSIYTRTQKSAFQSLYERQMTYAAIAAEGIEGAVSRHLTLLRILARNRDIIAMNNDGKALLEAIGKESFFYVKDTARVGDTGWSVIVMSSEKLLMPEFQGIKRHIILLSLLLAAFFITAAYVASA